MNQQPDRGDQDDHKMSRIRGLAEQALKQHWKCESKQYDNDGRQTAVLKRFGNDVNGDDDGDRKQDRNIKNAPCDRVSMADSENQRAE
jgi:hypothetical protein